MAAILLKPTKNTKLTITRNELMIVELLQSVVRCLYDRLPEAKLLHADIVTKEADYDSVNTKLYIEGTFAVAVTSVIKVDLNIYFSYIKSKGLRNNEWQLDNDIIIQTDHTNKVYIRLNREGEMYIHHGTDNFCTMIGNPPA